MKRSLVGIFVLLTLVATSGAICKSRDEQPDAITLKYWTVFVEPEELNATIAQFTATHPYINVEVTQLNPDEYEDKLIQAWLKGEGPDIFSVPNSHLGSFKDLILPMPPVVNITAVETKESLGKKETIVTPQTLATISERQVSSVFPQVVYDDVVFDHQGEADQQSSKKVFGLPLSMDTLVLYYNKDMLNRAKIPLPPETWQQFVEQVPKLTLVDVDNNIIQSGAAIGTSNNVPRVMDMVSLLMMQNGATMVIGNQAAFGDGAKDQKDYIPGAKALEFYTSFANPDVEWYSWNAEQPDALEAFIAEQTAFFIGYHYNLADIQSRAPSLNFDITAIPQTDPNADVNYANYWVETVASSTDHPDEAWALVQAITSEEAIVQSYLETTQKPAALKTLLDEQSEDFVLAIFADQALTAQSWYAGSKPEEVEDLFDEMVTIVNEGRLAPDVAVKNTADQVSLTYENAD